MKSARSGLMPFFILFLVLFVSSRSAPAQSTYASLLRNRDGARKLSELTKMEEDRTPIFERLSKLSRDPNPMIRLRCAEVLGRIGDPAGVALLERLLEDRNEDVVETAIFSLGLIGDGSCVEPLRRAISETGRRHKIRALEALGATKQREVAADIGSYLSHFNASLRATAAVALAMLGDTTAAELCATTIFDPDPRVLSSVVYAMGRLGYGVYEKRIVELLGSGEVTVRMRAAEALGRLQSKKAIDELYAMTGDEDRMTALKAAEALSRIDDKKCARAFEELLSSRDTYMQVIALEGLTAAGRKQAFEGIIPLLRSTSQMIRSAALKAAGATGREKAREHLLEAYRGGTSLDRMAALEALGVIGDRQDLALLATALSTGEDVLVREGAAAGLGCWPKEKNLFEPLEGGARPVDALIGAAGGDDWVVASIAAESLGKIGSDETIGDLISIYPKGNARLSSDRKLAILGAIKALGERKRIKEESSTPLLALLNEASRDPDSRIGEAACEIAGRFGGSLKPQPYGSWQRGDLPWGEPALPMGERRIRIVTDRGDIEVLLYGDEAPNIVKSIITLAEKGFYEDLTFHRVVPGFVIQGGCPRGDGWGDAGYFLRSQFNTHRYERGTVGMAHSGKDTAGSQFFITQTPQPHLNGRYTVIGKVTGGMEIVDTIEKDDRFTIVVVK
jgi:cyclophilin family peptidyl-prolyl cis-trans isomerase/HEAT repeat protein